MYTRVIKDFHKCWTGSLAKRRLCLGSAGVINCTSLSALSFWVSLFPRKRGYNTSSKYSELISFRIDWFYLLAVQGTLKSSPALSVISFCLFMLFMVFSRQEYWSGLPVLSPSKSHTYIFFLNGKILLLSILLLMQVRMPNAQGSQTNWNVKSWGQQKVYCLAMQGNRVAHDLKSLELPGRVWAALLKTDGWGRRVTESGISFCTVLWWLPTEVVSHGYYLYQSLDYRRPGAMCLGWSSN